MPFAPQVVYQDPHLLVLDKPVGLATTAPGGAESLFALARALDPRAPQLHPLSRLDLQVSGLVTFARTAEANRLALAARAAGTLRRSYLGLCTAQPLPSEGEWRLAIGIDPRDPKRRRALAEAAPTSGAKPVHTPGAKAAHTRYRVLASAGPIVALALWPVTGRTHQLRVHASAAGVPLFGDVAYGGLKRVTLPSGRVLSGVRVMLHCGAFCMPNPARPDRVLALSLAPPADLTGVWTSAGGDPDALTLQA